MIISSWERASRAPCVHYNGNERISNDVGPRAPEKEGTLSLQDKKKEKAKLDMDSIQDSYNTKVIDAAKTFLSTMVI